MFFLRSSFNCFISASILCFHFICPTFVVNEGPLRTKRQVVGHKAAPRRKLHNLVDGLFSQPLDSHGAHFPALSVLSHCFNLSNFIPLTHPLLRLYFTISFRVLNSLFQGSFQYSARGFCLHESLSGSNSSHKLATNSKRTAYTRSLNQTPV